MSATRNEMPARRCHRDVSAWVSPDGRNPSIATRRFLIVQGSASHLHAAPVFVGTTDMVVSSNKDGEYTEFSGFNMTTGMVKPTRVTLFVQTIATKALLAQISALAARLAGLPR